MSTTDFKQTPIQQLPQQPQQTSGNSGDSSAGSPSADPLIQNILNEYDNQNQQSAQDLQNNIPDTPDAIYNSEQSKYQNQQFGLEYQQQPPEHYQENYDEYYDGYPEDGQYEEQVQLKDLPFYKRWLYYFSFDDIKKSLLVSVLFVLLSFSIVDTQLIKYVPKFATIVDNELSLNLVGTIAKGLLAGLLFFIISLFI
jgi:hypothetical protein